MSNNLEGNWYTIDTHTGQPNGDKYEFRKIEENYYGVYRNGNNGIGDCFRRNGNAINHDHGHMAEVQADGDIRWTSISLGNGRFISRREGGDVHKKKSYTEDNGNEESYEMLQNYCNTLLKIKQDVMTSIASEYAYLPNISSVSDEKVQVHWTKPHAVLPEYRKAKAMFCLESEWLSDTMLLRQIRDANARFGEELRNMNSDKAFEKACIAAPE